MYENFLNNLFDVYPYSSRHNELSSYEFMKTSVKESKNSYIFEVEMPGVRKENININLDGDNLEISVKNNGDFALKEGEKLILNERTTGSFRRTFYLGRHFTSEQVEANFENGILTVVLKKVEENEKPTRIEIK